MLLSQNCSRSYQNYLLSIVNSFKCRTHSNFSFAVTDIAADEPIHNFWTFHIIFYIVNRLFLIRCNLKWKTFFKFLLPNRIFLINKSSLSFSSSLNFYKFSCKFLNVLFQFFSFSFESRSSQTK